MRYVLPVALVGLIGSWVGWAALDWGPAGVVFAMICFWVALSFSLVAIGYLGLGAGLLGKASNGRRNPVAYLWATPFLVFMRLLRTFLTWRRHDEDPWNEVSEGLYVGRILAPDTLPSDVVTVVDMTSEFLEPEGIIDGYDYRCLPTLDGAVPSVAALRAFLGTSPEWQAPIYVHCAAGHGRSAMLAACLLVRWERAADVDSAMATMKKARARVHLTGEQRHCAERALKDA